MTRSLCPKRILALYLFFLFPNIFFPFFPFFFAVFCSRLVFFFSTLRYSILWKSDFRYSCKFASNLKKKPLCNVDYHLSAFSLFFIMNSQHFYRYWQGTWLHYICIINSHVSSINVLFTVTFLECFSDYFEFWYMLTDSQGTTRYEERTTIDIFIAMF